MKELLKRLLWVAAGLLIVCLSTAVTYGVLTQGQKILPPLTETIKSHIPKLPFTQHEEKASEEDKVPEEEEAREERTDSAFAQAASYQADKEARYQAFQAKHAELSPSEVVLRVNIGLDQPFYEGAQCIEDVTAFPLLVNKYHYLPEGYVPPNLVELATGEQLTAQTAEAFGRLQTAANQAGHGLSINTAYRSHERQKTLYETLRKQGSPEQAELRAARPGFSEHQTGNALDVRSVNESGAFEETAAYQWLLENSWQYGFIIRYPKGKEEITGYQFEPWHITYVGDAAGAMHAQGMETLEEYMVMVLGR